MPKSQTQLAFKALSKLQMPANQAGAEDVQAALDALPDVAGELSSLGVLSLNLSDDTAALEIEDDVFNGVATFLALRIQTEFGRPEAQPVEVDFALRQLRQILAIAPSYETAEGTYF